MPPFAAFWEGRDIDERALMGLTDVDSVRREKKERVIAKTTLDSIVGTHTGRSGNGGGVDARAALGGALDHLSASPAAVALVNLEDLWLEKESQNVPGTGL